MKKIIVSITAASIVVGMGINAAAYTFPTPDWGALLSERRAMVNETDFELYTEGEITSAPYYGAKFEPRGGTYIGMISENATDFLPVGSYLTYVEEMGQPDLYYPANQMVKSDDVIATIGWTVNDLNIDYNHIRNVLDTLNKYNKPMFIRFANEMNSSVLGDNPDIYVDVFRNVANMVHEYPNLAVVWSPLDLGGLDRPFEYYYPGDEYVDWVGISCYSIKYFQGNLNTAEKDSVYFMTGDNAWATNRIKPFMKFLESNNINKPVMISEGGVAVDNKFGEDLEWWSSPRLRNLLWSVVMKYPQVKLINYFNTQRNENESFYISNHTYACNIFKEAEESGAYIRSFSSNSDFSYQRADAGETIVADKNGSVNLYTLAYIHSQPNITVNYWLDGEWYSMSSDIPYKTEIDINSVSDGAHNLKITSYGIEKNYVFYKSGNCVRFGGEPDSIIVQENIRYPEVKVVLNGKTLRFEQPAIIKNDNTLVPMRTIFENLGAMVSWNGEERSITATKGNNKIYMQIDNNTMYVNEKEISLEVAPQLINDNTMVPVRAISEALECNVGWDGDIRTVFISN